MPCPWDALRGSDGFSTPLTKHSPQATVTAVTYSRVTGTATNQQHKRKGLYLTHGQGWPSARGEQSGHHGRLSRSLGGFALPGMLLHITFMQRDLPHMWLCTHKSRAYVVPGAIQQQQFLSCKTLWGGGSWDAEAPSRSPSTHSCHLLSFPVSPCPSAHPWL